MKFEIGVQFSVVALQAVMAALLEGDTIHHALGIPCFLVERAKQSTAIGVWK